MQRRYVYKYDIAAFVYELYYLLGFAVDIGRQQTGELSYAVVVVDYKVARFEAVELLYEHCRLAPTSSIGLKREPMKAVEYLVVGEEAYLKVVVYKTLVQRFVYSLERNIVASVVENRGDTVYLLLAVGGYVYAVAVGEVLLYVFNLTDRKSVV